MSHDPSLSFMNLSADRLREAAGRWALRVARELGVFLLFAAWASVVTRPLAFRMATHTLVGPDPLSHLWLVGWLTGHAFQPSQLFQGNIFHPAPHAALFSDLSLGTDVLVLPLRLITTEPLVLFNVATLVALAFGGWAFHALVHGLTGNRWAGIFTGLLAAFSPEQMLHVYHLNLLSMGWLAVFLLGMHRIAERPSAGNVVLTGVAAALNAQSSGYYAVAAGVIAIVFVAFRARAFLRPRSAVALVAAALLGAVLTLPYVHEFQELREEQGGLRRPLSMSVNMSFQPARDLKSPGFLYRRFLGDDEGLFPGLLVLALGAFALVRGGRTAYLFASAALVLVVLSLGPQLTLGSLTVPLPYLWLYAVPPFDSMRHPITFAAVALFLLAVLAGIGWSRLPLRKKWWGGPAILALAVAETLGPVPRLRPVPPGVPPAYQALESLPPGAILEVPPLESETLVWAARHGRPVVNGGGAFAPLQTLVLERYIRRHWLDEVPADIDASRPTPYLVGRFGVRYVILPTGRVGNLERLAAAFDRSRIFRLAAVASDGDRIYEVRPEAGGRP